MTRDRIPPGNVLQEAYGVLDKYKISRTFFVKTEQEGCALAASDLNAANGITATSTVLQSTGAEQKKKKQPNAEQKNEQIIQQPGEYANDDDEENEKLKIAEKPNVSESN